MTRDIEQFEQELSEKQLEEQVQKVEIRDVEVDDVDGLLHLCVFFETVSGSEYRDWLPMPESYHPAHSDLVCLIEFVGGSTSDLSSLEGQRVPFRDGDVLWGKMRDVLEQETHAANEWDYEKRMSKVGEQTEARW